MRSSKRKNYHVIKIMKYDISMSQNVKQFCDYYFISQSANQYYHSMNILWAKLFIVAMTNILLHFRAVQILLQVIIPNFHQYSFRQHFLCTAYMYKLCNEKYSQCFITNIEWHCKIS